MQKILAIIKVKKLMSLSKFISPIVANGQKVRLFVQMIFLFTIFLIGFEFYYFIEYYKNGGSGIYFERPPGVEGFLPISSLISLKYWLATGIFNTIHPSGLVILLIIIIIGLFLKKSFCSWVCPVGFISENLWSLGEKLFKKNIKLPKWLDYPFRSLKYLLLIFFLHAIFWTMDLPTLQKFIYSPYNKVADIKMLLFFINISEIALWTLGILILLSVVIKNFWCRYLCPYGALLGFLSIFSPVKVTRIKETCIDCESCTQACPNLISVHSKIRIKSDECTACRMCINACPVEDTLNFKISKKSKPVPAWAFGLTIVLLFLLGSSLARVTGYWQNSISDKEYQKRILEIDRPIYDHNRGQVPEYSAED